MVDEAAAERRKAYDDAWSDKLEEIRGRRGPLIPYEAHDAALSAVASGGAGLHHFTTDELLQFTAIVRSRALAEAADVVLRTRFTPDGRGGVKAIREHVAGLLRKMGSL